MSHQNIADYIKQREIIHIGFLARGHHRSSTSKCSVCGSDSDGISRNVTTAEGTVLPFDTCAACYQEYSNNKELYEHMQQLGVSTLHLRGI